jgi:hypothetical protein
MRHWEQYMRELWPNEAGITRCCVAGCTWSVDGLLSSGTTALGVHRAHAHAELTPESTTPNEDPACR